MPVHDLLCVIPQMRIVCPGELSATTFHPAISHLEHTAARECRTLLMAMGIPAITVTSVLCCPPIFGSEAGQRAVP